jgi:hypothetical protein
MNIVALELLGELIPRDPCFATSIAASRRLSITPVDVAIGDRDRTSSSSAAQIRSSVAFDGSESRCRAHGRCADSDGWPCACTITS